MRCCSIQLLVVVVTLSEARWTQGCPISTDSLDDLGHSQERTGMLAILSRRSDTDLQALQPELMLCASAFICPGAQAGRVLPITVHIVAGQS